MSSIPKDQANTDATTAQTAIKAASDQNFIDSTDTTIAGAIAQGAFFVSATTWAGVDNQAVIQYYTDLGYQVFLPDLQVNNGYQNQPAQLFGQFLVDFWNNSLYKDKRFTPLRLLISWQ